MFPNVQLHFKLVKLAAHSMCDGVVLWCCGGGDWTQEQKVVGSSPGADKNSPVFWL